MSVNSILTKDYERNDIFAVPENKANSNPISKALITGLVFSAGCVSVADNKIEKFDLTYDQVIGRTMHPFTGQSNPGVDTSTLHGKVMCGYQGWFTCPGDVLAIGRDRFT